MVGVWKYSKTRPLPDGGVDYRVYAPNAESVEVMINETTLLPLKKYSDGIWSVKDLNSKIGDTYYFLINSAPKIDPTAIYNSLYIDGEFSPRSVLYESNYSWTDSDWLLKRKDKNYIDEPLLIYEVHIGSWGEGMTYRKLAEELPKYIKDSGFNAVQFMPLQEHFLELSWGYMANSWFAPASRYGTPDDLKYLIDMLHHHKIPVIFDLLVFHFPKDSMALSNFDGTPLFEYETDLPNFAHNVWGTEVMGFNKPHVRDFLLSSLNHWLDEFHFDGIRIDAVTDIIDMSLGLAKGIDYYPGSQDDTEDELLRLVRNETGGIKLFRQMRELCTNNFPGVVMMGEDGGGFRGITKTESEDPDYWLGFDLKYSMATSWIVLPKYFMELPENRSGQTLYDSLEIDQDQKRIYQLSHDETTHMGTGSIYRSLKVENEDLRTDFYKALLLFYVCLPGKKLFFIGTEWGNYNSWNGGNHEYHPPLPSELSTNYLHLDEKDRLPAQKSIYEFFQKLAKFYKNTKDLYTQDLYLGPHMEWIKDYGDDFIVYQRGQTFNLFNFSEQPKTFTLKVKEILFKSTDQELEIEADTITLPATSGVSCRLLF